MPTWTFFSVLTLDVIQNGFDYHYLILGNLSAELANVKLEVNVWCLSVQH